MKEISNLPDAELIKLAQDGEDAAFAILVTRYESRIAKTVIGMLGDTIEADDVGQETFVRFYRSLGSFRGDAGLGTYLTRIAINLSLNELKRRNYKDCSVAASRFKYLQSKTRKGYKKTSSTRELKN